MNQYDPRYGTPRQPGDLPQPYGQQPPGHLQPGPDWHVMPQVAPKSVLGALVISFFLPGVGAMYAGEVTWGIVILALWLVSIPLTLVTIGFITGFICWIVGMISGVRAAQRWNREHGIIS